MLDDTTSEPKRRAPLAVWLARCQTAPFPQFSCDRDGKKIYFEIIFDFGRLSLQSRRFHFGRRFRMIQLSGEDARAILAEFIFPERLDTRRAVR